MKRLFQKMMSGLQQAPSRPQSVRPQLEALEERAMMSVTDMTGVAQLFSRHSGPTVLNLNFDGWTAQGVSSFQSTSGNRVQDMHDIIFRVSEIFAPFDVEVRRISGNGAYDSSSAGNTTIFIGDKSSNGTGVNNGTYAGTPWVYCDFPGQVQGIAHRPNSDAFDIGYVDPVYNGGSWTNLSIAQGIAHEAGHTFGLAHVLSSPSQEMMSYDANNTRFINSTFNITNLNNSGTTTAADPSHAPEWHLDINWGFGTIQLPTTITTQNSYTFLQTVLGSRATGGDFGNVADATAVDSTYVDGVRPSIATGGSSIAGLQRPGDFDVFQYTASSTRQVVIDVGAYGGSSVDTVLFVYDSTGKTLLAFNDDRAGGGLNSQLIFSVTAGTSYKIVVGSYGANSVGSYQLILNNYYPLPIYNLYLTPVFQLPIPVETMAYTQPLNYATSSSLLALPSQMISAGRASDTLSRTVASQSQAPIGQSLLTLNLAFQGLDLLRY